MVEQLKPCPFCGGLPAIGVKWKHKVKLYHAFCQNCAAKTANSKHKEEVAALWNTRHMAMDIILSSISDFFKKRFSLKGVKHEE